MHPFDLSLPQPYDWNSMLNYLTHPSGKLLHVWDGEWLYRWLSSDDEAGIVFRARPDEALKLVRVEVLNREDEASAEQVRDFVSEWWDLKTNLQPFIRLAEKDDVLGPLVKLNPGLRIGGIPDLWECATWSIVGQQVNNSFASTLKNRLIENYGQKREWESFVLWQFPTKEKLVGLKPADLKALSISQRKAEYIIGFAQLMIDGRIDKEKLRDFSQAAKASKELTRIRGIGKWSANYILLRCLRYPDAFPLGDAALYNAVKDLLNMDRKPTDDELLELAIPWEGWQAYAAYHLWYGG